MDLSVVALLLTFPLLSFSHSEHDEAPKVLLISLDGFRHDYMSRFDADELPNLRSIQDRGVYARNGIKSIFVTKTFPNHVSMVTGLYAETHGVVANFMYDPVFNETFHVENTVQQTDSKWCDNGAEPLWVTNQIHDKSRRSGAIFWPCSNAPMKGHLPSTVLMYDYRISAEASINVLVNWFTDAAPINLGLIYFNEPGYTGHLAGPDSPKINAKIKELDELLGNLFDRLRDANILDDLNVVVTSDHGMAFTPKKKHIFLEDHTDLSLFRIVGGQVVTYIIPHQDQLERVYESLTKIPNCDTYKKEEIPLRYHYSNNRRITPIIVVAHEGYTIFGTTNETSNLAGEHGYDNELPSMSPFFMARGPAFKEKYSIETFNITDIYPLLCHVLGITPAPNNGSFVNVRNLLRVKEEHHGGSIALIYLIVIPVCLGVCGMVSAAACCQVRSIRRRQLNFNSFHDSASFTKLKRKAELISDSDDETNHYP